MSKNFRKCLKPMQLYCKADNPKIQKSLLKEMSKNDNYFKALHEIVHNISVEKLKIPLNEKKKLKKFIKIFDKILCKPKSKLKRGLLVKQSGGFLPILLPIVGAIVAELISNAISKES